MAYNGIIHVDDWDAPIVPTDGAPHTDIVALSDSLLASDALTNPVYGSTCRYFATDGRSGDSLAMAAMHKLKDIPANTSLIHTASAISMSACVRTRRFGAGNDGGIILIPRYANSSTFCSLSFNMYNTTNTMYITSNSYPTSDLWIPGRLNVDVRHSFTAQINRWYGIRMDVITEGSDVRMKAYLADGADVLNAVDGFGDPVWTKVIECVHVDGTAVPTVVQGTLSSNFGNTTPPLLGTPAFAFGSWHNPQMFWMTRVKAHHMAANEAQQMIHDPDMVPAVFDSGGNAYESFDNWEV